MDSQQLASTYDNNTFGVSRRTFFKLAAVAGISATGGMLVFPEQAAHAAFTEPTVPQWPTLSGNKIRFSVHSDTHVGASISNNYRDKIPAAFSALYSLSPTLQAHFFVGDSADTGHPDQYTELAELLNSNAQKPVGIVMGNHEYYHWSGNKQNAQAEFTTFLASKLKVAGSFQIPGGANAGQIDADFVVAGEQDGGYHVIVAAPEPGGYDNSWYGAKRDWILERCAAAAAENPNKPIFLMTHHPFPDTVWYTGSNSWDGQFDTNGNTAQSGAFYQELCAKYPQLIHFSGHTHIPMADPRSIYQDGGFTLIQTATFANNFWMENDGHDETGATNGHPDAGWDANQCELVEIDPATQVVSIYRVDFRSGKMLGEPWVIDPSKGTTGFRYTHAGMKTRSKPPVVEQGAAVLVSEDSITAAGASFSIAADKVKPDLSGLEDDIVIAFRVEVSATSAPDSVLYNARFMSDYYKAESRRPATFTRPLFGAALTEDSEYTLRAWAVNPFDKETLVGETVFRTAAKVIPALGEPLLSLDFSTQSHADLSASAHNAVPTGALTYESDSLGVPVAVFNGSSAVGYDFTAEDYASIAQAETIEVLFQFTANPPQSYFDLFSSAQKAGQDLSYYAPQLQHYINTGSGWLYTEATVPLNTWTHILSTFDGETMNYYLNGQLVSTTSNPGSIPAPTTTATRWFVGADVNATGEMEKAMIGKVAFAKLTPGVASAAQAVNLYAASAPLAGTVAPPSTDEIGTAQAGSAYTIPALLFKDLHGTELQAIPSVTGPDGKELEVSAVTANAQGMAASPLAERVAYRFTPSSEGAHTITYQAGYAQRPSFELVVQAASTTPDSEEPSTPKPEEPPVSKPEETPGAGNGNGSDGGTGNGSDGGLGSDNKTPGTEATPTTPTTQKLAKANDPLDGGGALIGLAAAAGAAVCVARSFLKGEFREEESK